MPTSASAVTNGICEEPPDPCVHQHVEEHDDNSDRVDHGCDDAYDDAWYGLHVDRHDKGNRQPSADHANNGEEDSKNVGSAGIVRPEEHKGKEKQRLHDEDQNGLEQSVCMSK